MLTEHELQRYARQIAIAGFGRERQERLKEAKVFIVGAGGLGSIVSILLTVAGVGKLRIVDHDLVELSNLNRQILHWDEDLTRSKVESAKDKLQRLNPNVRVEAVKVAVVAVSENTLGDLAGDCDVIVDALDNFATRYLLNRFALDSGVPLFHGGIRGFEGAAMTIIPHQTACLRCLYREEPTAEPLPVIGVSPGVIGCIQATEVIKYLTGVGELLTNRLLIYDGLNLRFTEAKIQRDPNCIDCGPRTKWRRR